MNLHALRLFTKVAELKSVSKAAGQLMISQPAVTMQIRNLEQELGLKLIEAEGRGISLTSNGEFLFKEAQRLFNLEMNIEQKVKELKSLGIEELHIAATHVPAHYLLPKWIAKYKQMYPDINIEVNTNNSKQVLEDLLQYKINVGFVVQEDGYHEDVDYTLLRNLEYYFIVPYDDELAGEEVGLNDLMKKPFILREDGSSTKELLVALCKIHKSPPPKMGLQLSGINESIQAIAAGYGAMLAPSIAVQEQINRKQIAQVHVKNIDIERPIYLCMRKNEVNLSAYVQAFIDIISAE
ncbi:MAG TPA: LysR family transcriptional regulator [Bacillus bacterium]|nr:LysR family transcriptional regulator [Bacillus sp. (in: firmicutes)]